MPKQEITVGTQEATNLICVMTMVNDELRLLSTEETPITLNLSKLFVVFDAHPVLLLEITTALIEGETLRILCSPLGFSCADTLPILCVPLTLIGKSLFTVFCPVFSLVRPLLL
jgi:hypothetical protein